MTTTEKLLAGATLLALMTCPVSASSEDGASSISRAVPLRSIDFDTMASWLRSLYTEDEARALAAGAVALESRQCGCYDQPEPHYPYSVTVLSTPRGDLILRPQGSEAHLTFVRLAVRQGDLYCAVEPDGECFGRFADVCDFTDFRYGPQLVAYFPTCKSGDR